MRYFALNLSEDNTHCNAIILTESDSQIQRLLSLGWEEISSDQHDSITVNSISKEQVTIEELQAENKLLKAQLQAQSDRADFIEDCIAEMAMQVYRDV